MLSSVTQQPTYEVGFASGEYNSKTQDPSMKFSSVYTLILSDTVSKRDLLTLRPALHKTKVDGCVTNKFPIRFMMCNYVDPGVLRRQLEHRYVNIDRSIIASSGSNVRAIVDPHTEVISAIVESRKRARDLLLKMADTVQEDATLAVLEANRSALEATNAPNSTPKANSYNCAEQCQFVYLQDARVMNYLRQRLDVSNPNFVGLVVSAHCSHTPCHSCMTSFTREAETGGVFSVIVNGKPVHVLCSCRRHYERKDMLPYDKTHFFDRLKVATTLSKPYPVNLDAHSERMPYPVVLLEPNPDGSWKVGKEHYDKIQPSGKK